MNARQGYAGNKLSPYKAKEMLKDGTAHGKKLTERQKRYFQAIAHGWVPKAQHGVVVKDPPKSLWGKEKYQFVPSPQVKYPVIVYKPDFSDNPYSGVQKRVDKNLEYLKKTLPYRKQNNSSIPKNSEMIYDEKTGKMVPNPNVDYSGSQLGNDILTGLIFGVAVPGELPFKVASKVANPVLKGVAKGVDFGLEMLNPGIEMIGNMKPIQNYVQKQREELIKKLGTIHADMPVKYIEMPIPYLNEADNELIKHLSDPFRLIENAIPQEIKENKTFAGFNPDLAIERVRNIPVRFKYIPGKTYGYYDQEKIVVDPIKSFFSPKSTVKSTLWHELTHAWDVPKTYHHQVLYKKKPSISGHSSDFIKSLKFKDDVYFYPEFEYLSSPYEIYGRIKSLQGLDPKSMKKDFQYRQLNKILENADELIKKYKRGGMVNRLRQNKQENNNNMIPRKYIPVMAGGGLFDFNNLKKSFGNNAWGTIKNIGLGVADTYGSLFGFDLVDDDKYYSMLSDSQRKALDTYKKVGSALNTVGLNVAGSFIGVPELGNIVHSAGAGVTDAIGPEAVERERLANKSINTRIPPMVAYKYGGRTNMLPNVEVEKNEIAMLPDGSVRIYDLPSHENATDKNLQALPTGTKILSDRLGYAKLGRKAAGVLKKEEKKNFDNMGGIQKTTSILNRLGATKRLNDLFEEQEYEKNMAMRQINNAGATISPLDMFRYPFEKIMPYNANYATTNGFDEDSIVTMKKGGIYIKPSRRGSFTAWAKSHGMGIQEAARHVLANKDRYSSAIVKKANFARNAAKWNKAGAGMLVTSPPPFINVEDRLRREGYFPARGPLTGPGEYRTDLYGTLYYKDPLFKNIKNYSTYANNLPYTATMNKFAIKSPFNPIINDRPVTSYSAQKSQGTNGKSTNTPGVGNAKSGASGGTKSDDANYPDVGWKPGTPMEKVNVIGLPPKTTPQKIEVTNIPVKDINVGEGKKFDYEQLIPVIGKIPQLFHAMSKLTYPVGRQTPEMTYTPISGEQEKKNLSDSLVNTYRGVGANYAPVGRSAKLYATSKYLDAINQLNQNINNANIEGRSRIDAINADIRGRNAQMDLQNSVYKEMAKAAQQQYIDNLFSELARDYSMQRYEDKLLDRDKEVLKLYAQKLYKVNPSYVDEFLKNLKDAGYSKEIIDYIENGLKE